MGWKEGQIVLRGVARRNSVEQGKIMTQENLCSVNVSYLLSLFSLRLNGVLLIPSVPKEVRNLLLFFYLSFSSGNSKISPWYSANNLFPL